MPLRRRGGVFIPVVMCLVAGCGVASSSSPREASVEQLTLISRDARLAGTLYLPKADTRVPAIVMVHGSGPQTAGAMAGNAERLRTMGVAALVYDKRGVGDSTGEYTGIGPGNSERMFDLLAADALAGVEALARRSDIDRSKIGLLGISQGGWIAPLAATRSDAVKFVISLSGPAVTVGEEIAYSRLAGADPGSEQGLSDEEIERRYKAFTGPHGYDPAPQLRALRVPSLWILGEHDRSLPVAQSVERLERVKRETGTALTVSIVPGADHGMRNTSTGAPVDVWRIIAGWLEERGILRKS